MNAANCFRANVRDRAFERRTLYTCVYPTPIPLNQRSEKSSISAAICNTDAQVRVEGSLREALIRFVSVYTRVQLYVYHSHPSIPLVRERLLRLRLLLLLHIGYDSATNFMRPLTHILIRSQSLCCDIYKFKLI